MPSIGRYSLALANAHTQLANGAGSAEQTLTLEKECNAVILSVPSASPGDAVVSFNNTAATATNGISIIKGAQPVVVPIGYNSHNGHVLRYQGLAASSFLNVLQLS